MRLAVSRATGVKEREKSILTPTLAIAPPSGCVFEGGSGFFGARSILSRVARGRAEIGAPSGSTCPAISPIPI